MPQVFQVLRCYKCLVFQVHQTKKSNKWECKLCGEKQSLKRHYGIGTARECRIHVQKLNCIRGEIDELNCSRMIKNLVSDDETELENLQSEKLPISVEPVHNSKWSTFVEDPEPIAESNNDPKYLGDAELVLEIPKKRRKEMGSYSKNNHKDISSSVFLKSPTISTHINKIPYHTSVTNPNIITPVMSQTQTLEKENTKPVTHKKFIPPTINKHSKWAQYADDDNSNIPSSPGKDNINLKNKVKNEYMFSLCDDTELDDVLNLL